MKVLHYCHLFSPLSQTFIYDVVIQLDEMGVEQVIVANKLLNEADRPFERTIQLPKLKETLFEKVLHNVQGKIGLSGHTWEERNDKSKQAALLNCLVDEKPDIVHAHFGPQGFFSLPATLLAKIPLVVSFHGFDAFRIPKENGGLEKLTRLFKDVTWITVVSELMKNHLIGLGCPADKLRVIHVGKKIAAYPFAKREHKIIKKFLSIGRLTDKKGHEDCIKAFLKLRSDFPDLTLDIIGEGELDNKLNELIIKNELSQVRLLGSISHQETVAHLKNADAFILCSKTASDGDQEGIPTVLMEAQAMGIPCISTFHSGIPEVIPSENQWMLAEEGNINSIAGKIRELVNTSSEVLINATQLGREKVSEEFNLETEVNKLKELYEA